MEGIVHFGINNIYTVKVKDEVFRCRIKGKILKSITDVYNPIAVGDRVEVSETGKGEAMITERLPRKNEFTRWNKKRQSYQTIAANIDLAVCVTSPESPPFRPRFVDRLLVNARGSYPVLIALNKADQGIPQDVAARLGEYRAMGYSCCTCSALTGMGVSDISLMIRGKLAVFIGQSGVGKSSLINALEPSAERVTGDLSAKYNRGSHTTSFAVLIPLSAKEGESGPEGFSGAIIDTPGIREIEIGGMEPYEVAHYFPDFEAHASDCGYTPCLHLHEPDCGVKKALMEGLIFPDRYESYARILQDLISSGRQR